MIHKSSPSLSRVTSHETTAAPMPSTPYVARTLDTNPDKIPTVVPTVDYQDKLWTQIDVLDDVKQMAQQQTDELFSEAYMSQVMELRKAQIDLLKQMKKVDTAVSANVDHRLIWAAEDLDQVRKLLYNGDYFESMSGYVEGVREHLDSVSERLRNIKR